MSINLTDEIEVKTKKGKLGAAKQIFLEGDTQTVEKEIQDINSRHNDLSSKHESLSSTVSEHTKQIESNQSQITANKSAQDEKNTSLDANMAKLNTRDDQITELVKGVTATGGASVATAVSYDNTSSNLDAATVQGALDELVTKKVSKEDIAQELGDSKEKVISQFALPFREIESPEFIKIIVDANDHLLFTINLDGEVDWGKGIPAPIKAKFQEIINQYRQDKTDLLGILDKTTIKDEEGIVFETPFRYIQNDEFIFAKVDADDRLLFGIEWDGTPKFGKTSAVEDRLQEQVTILAERVSAIIGDEDITSTIDTLNELKKFFAEIENTQSLTDILSNLDNVAQNLDKTTIKDEKGNIQDTPFKIIENPEYLAVEKDAEDRVLSATYNDGSHYSHNLKSETIDAKVDKEEGKSLIDEDVADAHSAFEDPERRTEIVTDAEDKVLSYRDADGKKHEHDMEVTNLDVSNLNLQGNSVNNIQDALKANGFDTKGKTDWSDWYDKHDSALELPIPTKAVINITGVNQMPSKKLVNDKAYIEFFDFAGNYFKIKAYLNAQGASTMYDPMKSCAIDLFSDDWGGNEFEIKFGDWVAQDGFHLKAFYKDSLKSIQPICYEIGEQITSFLNVRSNRFHISSDNVLIGGTGDMDNDVSQAKCMPSQFPCEVYLNGEYYGLFIWSLKKNRKNYSMNKKDYTSILIDNVGGMFNGDSFNWIKAEIRNPKKLICVDGEEYDADTHMGELIGTDTVAGQQYTFSKLNAATTGTDTFKVTSVDYNAANKDMVNTAKTKTIIEACQAYKSEVNSASTNEEKKKIVEKSFDVDNLLAYIIFCELTYNQDGWYNNAQITIFNKKVGYNIYDCDSCLGKSWNGLLWTSSLSREVLGNQGENPLFAIKGLYTEEIKTMYKTLRDKGIISKENLNKIVDDWFNRLGTDVLKRSVTKWNNSPSYRKPTNLDEHWEPYIPLSKSELESINSYNAETNYSVGTIVCYGDGGYDNSYYKCVKECLGSTPTTDGSYYINGMYDSKERIKMWIEKRIDFCDVLWNYK